MSAGLVAVLVEGFFDDLREAHHGVLEHILAVHVGVELGLVVEDVLHAVFAVRAGLLHNQLLGKFALGVQVRAENAVAFAGAGPQHYCAGAIAENDGNAPASGDLSRPEEWISEPTTSTVSYMPVRINWSATDRA